LPEIQNHRAVRVGYIVGGSYGVGDIGLVALIAPDHPFAFKAALAVA
jgi:hypothetical protein